MQESSRGNLNPMLAAGSSGLNLLMASSRNGLASNFPVPNTNNGLIDNINLDLDSDSSDDEDGGSESLLSLENPEERFQTALSDFGDSSERDSTNDSADPYPPPESPDLEVIEPPVPVVPKRPFNFTQ